LKKEILELKIALKEYIASLGMYDYIGLGVVFLLFLLLFFISIMARKKPIVATIIGFMSLVILFFGPLISKIALDMSVRKSEILELKTKQLQYVNSLLVNAKIKNRGLVTFNECDIKIKIIKKSNNKIKAIKYRLKPLKKYTYNKKVNLAPSSQVPIKIIIDDFKVKLPYELKITSQCKGSK